MEEPTVCTFKIYCIEEYRKAHGMTAPETVDLFLRYDVFHLLEDETLMWCHLNYTVGVIEDYIRISKEMEESGHTSSDERKATVSS